MVNVSIYTTAGEAEESLESVIKKNNSALESLKSNLITLSSHKSKIKCRTLASKTELSCLFFLNKEEGRYDFSYGVNKANEGIAENTCETIEELVSEIKNCLTAGEIFGKYSVHGVKIIPLFYTVIEPEVLTKSEQKKVSDILGWKVDRVGANGLSADEIEKFVSLY